MLPTKSPPHPDTLRLLHSRRRPTPAPASARRPGPPAPSPASGSPSSTYPSGMRGRAGSLASSAFSLSSREDRSRVLEMCSLRRTRNVGYYGCLRAGMSVRCRPGTRPSGSGTTCTMSLLIHAVFTETCVAFRKADLVHLAFPQAPPPHVSCLTTEFLDERRYRAHNTTRVSATGHRQPRTTAAAEWERLTCLGLAVGTCGCGPLGLPPSGPPTQLHSDH